MTDPFDERREAELAAQRLAARVARLDVLADIGMGMAKRIARRMEAAEDQGLECGEAALAYDRINRAVRQCVYLQNMLEADAAARRKDAAAAWAAKLPSERLAEAKAEKQRRGLVGRGETVVAAVETMIDRQAGDTQAGYDAMARRFRERLDDYGPRDFARRPLSAIIAEICQALGVVPEWSLWAGEDWAVEEAAEDRAGSPYAKRRPQRPEAMATAPPTIPPTVAAPPALAAGAALAILERLPP